MQKLIDLEIVLILVALGIDILLEAVGMQDWIAAAIVIAGFCMILGLYWHTLYLDSLFADLRAGMGHVFHHQFSPHQQKAPDSHPISDLPAVQVADRPVIHVGNFLLSKNFYVQALKPLGYTVTMDLPALSMVSLGIGDSSDVWIKGDGSEAKMRVAFRASQESMVDRFFDAALDAGATEEEAPGPRKDRAPGAYAAAVLDPDSYIIEAYFEPTPAS